MMPSRVAIALTDRGWILRNDIIWHKRNGMPESVTDRLATKHEHLFLLAKSPTYYFDLDAIREPHSPATIRRTSPNRVDSGKAASEGHMYHAGTSPQTLALSQALPTQGKNPGDVWQLSTRPNPEAHFAMFPPDIPQRCIAASTAPGDLVLDPFVGAGTTGAMAKSLRRRFVGIELVADYAEIAARRIAATDPSA